MRKYVEVLTAATSSKTAGNHSVIVEDGAVDILSDETGAVRTVQSTRRFQYHGNTVCAVDDYKWLFWLSHAGWFTSSTSCAVNGYKYYFESIGYKEEELK